jgi:hypothetical protein
VVPSDVEVYFKQRTARRGERQNPAHRSKTF